MRLAPALLALCATALASTQVQPLTLGNYKNVLAPGAATATSAEPDNLMIFITGANKTCFGRCQHAEEQWNLSLPALAASPDTPRLALLDCETNRVLCHAWFVGPPAVYYMQIHQSGSSQTAAPVDVYLHDLNMTSVTAGEIAELHTSQKFKSIPPYVGFWHPKDGTAAKLGANVALGYALWFFGVVPSWALMVAISMISRSFLGRGNKTAGRPPRPPQQGASAAQPGRPL